MFIVKQIYGWERITGESYKTEDEALAAAIASAELDYEGCSFLISEVKSVVKPDPRKNPVKIYEGDEAVGTLIEQKKED